MFDQFQAITAKALRVIKPATGIVAGDFDRDAAMSAETQLLWAGKVSVRISAKLTCQIGDASIQGCCHILSSSVLHVASPVETEWMWRIGTVIGPPRESEARNSAHGIAEFSVGAGAAFSQTNGSTLQPMICDTTKTRAWHHHAARMAAG